MAEFNTDIAAAAAKEGFPGTRVGLSVQYAIFEYDQGGTAGTANDTLVIGSLPSGKVTLLGRGSVIAHGANTGATMDLGWKAYVDRDGDAVAADADGLVDGESIASAGDLNVGSALNPSRNKIFESRDGVTIVATFKTAGPVANVKFGGWLAYIQHG